MQSLSWVAVKMLVGDRKRYLIIVFGVAFASMMMAHQMSVFWGVMRRTVNQILDVHPNGVWVVEPNVQYVDEIKGIPDSALQRVRSVPGVEWAVPLYKGLVRAQAENGNYRQVVLLGLDDDSLMGLPPQMVLGSAADLGSPEGVIVDKAGYTYLWPDQPMQLGHELEINERRAVLVGICEASPPFQTMPIMYTRFSEAVRFALPERHVLSCVLVGTAEHETPETVCRRIEKQTGLQAMSSSQFCRTTLIYYMRFTGIPTNFGIVVFLGFVVGVAIAGQNFFLFTVDNLSQFGLLKALGVSPIRLTLMISLQAAIVAMLGYGLGMGMAAILIESTTRNIPHLAGFELPWPVMLITGVSMLIIMISASLVSIRRVLVLEPFLIFRR